MGGSEDDEMITSLLNADSEAEKRREKRRQRILDQAEKRISAILQGHDGEERRNAPVLEGGDFKLPTLGHAPLSGPIHPVADETTDLQFEQLAPHFSWTRWISGTRFYLVFAIGLLFRVLVAAGLLNNVVLPWTIFYISYELVSTSKTHAPFPDHGYLVNTLLWMGLVEKTVISIGFLWESVCNFASDSLVAMFAFFVADFSIDLIGVLLK